MSGREGLAPRVAEIQLGQYGERGKPYETGTEKALYEIALALLGEVHRLREEAAHVRDKRDGQIVAWLCKKAGEYGSSNRENRAKAEAVARMADKLSRGAVREPGEKVPPVTIEGYRGELAALRGTLAAIRTTVQHGGMDDVRSLVTEYYADEHAAYAEQEKDTREGESTQARQSADRLKAFIGGARLGRTGGDR